MIVALLLFTAGMLLSAFFSGSETGLYRVTRVRLAVEALAGNVTSRTLLWLSNQPTLFVGTALVGNNLANYLVSLGVVMGSQYIFASGGLHVEILFPVLVAPFVFLFGELLPKNIFLDAPNRLLKRCTWPLVLSTIVFAPVTLLLWGFSRLAQTITQDSPQELQLRLARRELAELITEGKEAGILKPSQQSLAQAMLMVAGLPVKAFALPQGRVVRATTTMSKSDVLRLAQRYQRSLLPVEDPRNKRELVGYLRMMDLYLDDSPALPTPKPMAVIREEMSCLAALRILSQANDPLGHVVSKEGKTMGFVTGRELRMAMLRTK